MSEHERADDLVFEFLEWERSTTRRDSGYCGPALVDEVEQLLGMAAPLPWVADALMAWSLDRRAGIAAEARDLRAYVWRAQEDPEWRAALRLRIDAESDHAERRAAAERFVRRLGGWAQGVLGLSLNEVRTALESEALALLEAGRTTSDVDVGGIFWAVDRRDGIWAKPSDLPLYVWLGITGPATPMRRRWRQDVVARVQRMTADVPPVPSCTRARLRS